MLIRANIKLVHYKYWIIQCAQCTTIQWGNGEMGNIIKSFMGICLTEVQSANNNQFDYQDSSIRFVYLNRIDEKMSMLKASIMKRFGIVRCPSYFVRSHLFIKPTNKYFGSTFICQTSIDDYLRCIHIMNRIVSNSLAHNKPIPVFYSVNTYHYSFII